MNAIDFFCGGGGMTRGLLDANINVLFGLDFNPSCCNTYEHNNHIPYLNYDITNITGDQLIYEFPVLKDTNELLMVGCAPCQPFSRLNRNDPNKHQSVNLLNEFGRLIKEIKPAHILIENVATIKRRGRHILNKFLEILEEEQYMYDSAIINAKDYGVPQNRKRFVLIASRIFEPHIPPATHGPNLLPYVTVRRTIEKYPAIQAGEENIEIANHKAAKLSQLNLQRIMNTPHDGGSRTDWPDELWLNCHKKNVGHTDVYGRMYWDLVSPTLTSKCVSISNGRFGHPEQNRAISLREAAALQTFKDDYVFEGSQVEIAKQIGNAVPVQLAYALGRYILNQHMVDNTNENGDK